MKTEKEKMIAGELYFSEDPELVADRKHAREQMTIINQATNTELRSQLLKESFGSVAGKIYMEPQVAFDYGYNIHIGKNFYANYNNTWLDVAPITIGNNCMFGPNVQLYTATHPLNPVKRNSGLESAKPITIGDNVWLGGGVIVVPGITLGNNVVVGAGSVVTKSFPDDAVIAGNPAKIIKMTTTEDDDLAQQREKITALDREIVALLEKRMAAVTKVAEYKKNTGKAVLDSNREAVVLEQVAQQVGNPVYEDTIVATFEDIMKHSRQFQNEQIEKE